MIRISNCNLIHVWIIWIFIPLMAGAQTDSLSPKLVSEEASYSEDSISQPSATFLLPLDGDILYERDIKLLAKLSGARPSGIQVLVDGYPLAQAAEIVEGVLQMEIQGQPNGPHYVTIQFFDTESKIVFREEIRFFIRAPEVPKEQKKSSFSQYGRVNARMDYKGGDAENRTKGFKKLELVKGISPDTSLKKQSLSQNNVFSQNLDGAMEGSYNVRYDRAEVGGKLLLRTDENEFRQASNRYTLMAKYRPWAMIRAGDIFPSYNELVLNNARVRGVDAGLNLVLNDIWWGTLKVTQGQTMREIPAHLLISGTDSVDRMDTVGATYAQNLVAARLGFGGGPAFDLGFTFLKIGSDRNSVDNSLRDSLDSSPPSENLVLGTDLKSSFWQERIKVYGEYAFSLYTENTSNGALEGSDLSINPKDYENLFVINQSTKGAPFLVSNDSRKSDVSAFVRENTAWHLGTVLALPLTDINSETEFKYKHQGLFYRSDGNPFLSQEAKDGFDFYQRFAFWQRRIATGMEFGHSISPFGKEDQIQRRLRGDLRLAPGRSLPTVWMGGGLTKTAPDTDSLVFESSLSDFNAGGFHQFLTQVGSFHTTVQYLYTNSDTRYRYPDSLAKIVDTNYNTRSNFISTQVQWKPRSISVVPRLSVSAVSSTGQSRQLNSNFGLAQTLLDSRLTWDATVTVGQYPSAVATTDLTLGQSLLVGYKITNNQQLRVREKSSHYGKRNSMNASLNYELFF